MGISNDPPNSIVGLTRSALFYQSQLEKYYMTHGNIRLTGESRRRVKSLMHELSIVNAKLVLLGSSIHRFNFEPLPKWFT